MAINKNYLLFCLIIVGLVCLSFQCNRRLDCANTKYSFSMGIKAYPDRDSIQIGDTIWLEVNEPTTLKDVLTNNMVNYSGAENLSTTIGIAELISVNNVDVKGNTFFNFFVQSGNEISRPDTNNFREYRFHEVNNNYQIKLGIIPTKAGVYKLFVGSAANVYSSNDRCTKATFTINFKETNQHLYFNEIVLPGVLLPSGGGIYLFKVK